MSSFARLTDTTSVGHRQSMEYLPLLARFFYSFIFIFSSWSHFTAQAIQSAEAHGAPLPGLLVPLSGLMALGGGLSILLGFRAQLGAWVLVAFLIPVTLVMHNFWAVTDPMMLEIQKMMFMKNMGLLGGAFLIVYFGSGPFSLDKKFEMQPIRRKIITMEKE